MAASSKFKIALIQLMVTANKSDNVSRAVKFIKDAASQGAKIIALPECFNSPYGTQYFDEYAEPIPGETTQALSDAAKSNQVYLLGGSFPEKSADGRVYNTSTFYSPDGSLIAKYSKSHLFDIDIPGKITFKESDILSPGNKLTTVETSFCKIGIGICYDMRFAEVAQSYANSGCKLLLYPGAFNMTTGPAHWELIQKCRAIDNQLYVAAISPARDNKSTYVAWGHSTVVNPWGDVVNTCAEEECIVYADIDLDYLDQVRTQIPLRSQKRPDLY